MRFCSTRPHIVQQSPIEELSIDQQTKGKKSIFPRELLGCEVIFIIAENDLKNFSKIEYHSKTGFTTFVRFLFMRPARDTHHLYTYLESGFLLSNSECFAIPKNFNVSNEINYGIFGRTDIQTKSIMLHSSHSHS